MEIFEEASKLAYLNTLSPAKAEEFKKLSPEEQRKKINIFWEQKKLAPTKSQPTVKSDKTNQPINMTGSASIGSIGDETSFSSQKTDTTAITAQPTNQPQPSSVETEQPKVPTYPPSREKLVQRQLKNIDRGMSGFYDTAQNVQIAIDRALEGDLYPEEIREFMIYKLQEKMKEFPADEIAAATNPERRAQLSAARKINTAMLNKLKEAYDAADDEVTKGNKKAGIITHLGHGINTQWLDKEDTRKTAAEKLMAAQEVITELNGLKYKLTAEEFAAKFKELTGENFDFNQIVKDFQSGEDAASGAGKMYVIGGVAVAVTGGLAAGAIAGGGAAAAGAGAAGAATAKTAITAGAIAKGTAIGAGTGAVVGGSASLAADTVDKLTNETANEEDFSGEELAKMGKNAGTAAVMGAVGGAAGGAITGTLMGTTLSAGAKIGVDIAANTVVGAGIDYAATGEITLEGTLMNATMSGLGAIAAYRGLKGAAQADVPPARIIGESIGDPKMHITKVTDYNAAVAAAKQAVDGADLKVAVAGYSSAPDGYEIKTTAFLNELIGTGDKGKTAIITSPTASKGSIDAIATEVAQANNAPITYLTAERYVKYIKPEEFPSAISTNKFNKAAKYAFGSGEDYSRAGADVSNSLIITGGRNVSVLDFKNAIDANNPVVLLRNNDLGGANFDVGRSSPNNAVAYIEEMIANPTGATNHTKHVDPQWWIDNIDKINRLVKIIDIDSPTAIKDTRAFLTDTQPTIVKTSGSNAGVLTGNPELNIIKVKDYNQALIEANQALGDADLKLAVAGYSAAPAGYEAKTTAFLNELVHDTTTSKTAFITSPTASQGSIDAITTKVAQRNQSPIAYLTAEQYTKYINPAEFPNAIDISLFNKVKKYAFESGDAYSKAGADLSNGLVITGGRDVSVKDFKNALESGNPIVLVRNEGLGDAGFDATRNRPNNAVEYIIDKINNPNSHPDIAGVDHDFWTSNNAKFKKLIKIVDIDSPIAAKEARTFLDRHKKIKELQSTALNAETKIENIYKDPKTVRIGDVEYTTGQLYSQLVEDADTVRLIKDVTPKPTGSYMSPAKWSYDNKLYFEVDSSGKKHYLDPVSRLYGDPRNLDTDYYFVRPNGDSPYNYGFGKFPKSNHNTDLSKHQPRLLELRAKYGSDDAAINAYINEYYGGKEISQSTYDIAKMIFESALKLNEPH